MLMDVVQVQERLRIGMERATNAKSLPSSSRIRSTVSMSAFSGSVPNTHLWVQNSRTKRSRTFASGGNGSSFARSGLVPQVRWYGRLAICRSSLAN
jgi:hypothetical protein